LSVEISPEFSPQTPHFFYARACAYVSEASPALQ
jgi:hypothetical protein